MIACRAAFRHLLAPTAFDLVAACHGMRWRDHFTLELMRDRSRQPVSVAFNPGESE